MLMGRTAAHIEFLLAGWKAVLMTFTMTTQSRYICGSLTQPSLVSFVLSLALCEDLCRTNSLILFWQVTPTPPAPTPTSWVLLPPPSWLGQLSGMGGKGGVTPHGPLSAWSRSSKEL